MLVFYKIVLIYSIWMLINSDTAAESADSGILNSEGTVLNSVLSELNRLHYQFEDREKHYAMTEKYYKGKLADLENKWQKSRENEKYYEKKLSEMEENLKNSVKRQKHSETQIGKLKSQINELSHTFERTDIPLEKLQYSINMSDVPSVMTYSANQQDVKHHGLVKRSKSEDVADSAEDVLTRRLLTPGGVHHVAFTASLSVDASGLGQQQVVPFDRVLLNEGQAFDSILHTFICPVNGIYMFMSSLLVQQNDHVETEIVKDGTVIAQLYAAGSTGSHGYDQGFNSGNIRCNKAERVWVRIVLHEGSEIHSEQYTTFSGYLLWEIPE